jgi:TP901 family phage tail tape measure protein
MANDLFTLGLNVSATKSQMDKQLKQIAKELSDSRAVQVTGGLNLSESQKLLQSQLNTISKNLKVGVEIDTSAIKYQKDAINKEFSSGIKSHGVKIPFQFDLSDANAVKTEINKIVADITKNQGSLIKYKINVDENGQASRALLTYRNELNEVTNATLKLKNVGSWYDASGVEHHIVKWAEGHKTLSQNIEATARANQRQIESDNQVIRKKQELIAQMKLLTTQAEKAGLSLNSDNKNAFDNLSVSASTMEDIKQLESYLRLARTEYQTFNATISKGTHASSLEAMRNALQNMPNDIALLEARFNSIKMPDGVKVQIEQLKSDLASINSISEPSAKIAKYNELVSSLQSLQKQYQIAAQEQRNLNADTQAMQSASILTNRIITWMGENRNAAAQYDTELKKIIASLQNVNNKTDLTKLEQQFRKIQTQTQATDATSLGFFGNLKAQLKTSLATMVRYQLAYKIIQETTQAIKAMINAVCELDANLTEFNKVADLSAKQLENFADKAFASADKVGRTGQDMIEAATEFKRAGKDIETSLEMGEAALVMTNVADGIDQTSDAASTLISVLNGFNMDDSDAMSVVDKLNSVSNQSPVGFDNLADGLERVSGTMNQAGNSLDETIGMLTGGFTQLRNMEKVSSGLITISQRLRAVDEDGEAIDGLSAELESAFGSIGVAIEDANGDLRSTYDILHDYAQVFPTLTSEQKQYFGELAAGKRQVNVFNAIVDEMATVDTAINQSVDSLGAAEKENETYRQSIQGLKNEFENQFQMLSKEVIDSDWIKKLISAGTDFLEVLTNIVKQEDIMSGTIGVVTDLIKGLANILKDISGNDFVGSLIKSFLTFKTVTKGIDIFNFFKGKSESKSAMDAFFKSAMNGTLQLKDGFIQVGNAEKEMVKNTTSGLGNFEFYNKISWRPKKCATLFKVA